MTTNNFYYALTLAEQLYGLNMQEDQFEEIGLLAWNQIGNKRCKLYRYSVCLNNCQREIELPCNCDILEAVTTDIEDFQHVSNVYNRSQPGSFSTEQYIESMKAFKNSLYTSGKFVKYERVGNTLYLDQPYDKIHILYKGVILDDNGLPELSDKEALAIATYCAYVAKYKEGLRTNNVNIIRLSETLNQKWLRQCDAARVPEDISQNEMDEILDAKNNWNRKIFRKSYKPMR